MIGSSATSMRPAMMAPAMARTEEEVPGAGDHDGSPGGGVACMSGGAPAIGSLAARMVFAAIRSASIEPSIWVS
jgi:hypothetical protein